MPRRKPHSHKEKKAVIQANRAAKRGESPPPLKPKQAAKKKQGRSAFNAPVRRGITALETKFLALPEGFTERTRNRAWQEPLPRPLPPSSAVFDVSLVDNPAGYGLSVPSRPKFRLDMTKTQLEKNEEGLFKKWLEKTREIVHDWVDGGEEQGTVRSPNWFETNLEVWRQLWRVNEASNLILLLVDSRCPPVHCPPSLRTYLKKQKKEVIIVLTKADLVDAGALEGWKKWMKDWWQKDTPEAVRLPRKEPVEGTAENDAPADKTADGSTSPAAESPLEGPESSKPGTPSPESSVAAPPVQVVSVTSYDLDLLYAEGKHKKHKPLIGDSSRLDLLNAIKTVHERLQRPPEWAQKDPARLAEWKPPMRTKIDWDSLSKPAPVAKLGKGSKTKEERARERWQKALRQEERQSETTDTEQETERDETDNEFHRPDPSTLPLTIGLIGQPNVGKSSLLNALLGSTRVRASKTPGKTKHFQTIFWGSNKDVKIVDCPGLVCPSLVPMEIQSIAGVLPIAQIPSLPSCIHFAGDHLPLETIFKIPLPQDEEEDHEAKKTWREDAGRGERPPAPPKKARAITAGELLEARAVDRGFVTAKGGRPDTNRAANGIMRALADGRVRWGFWPSGGSEEGKGIWLDSTPLEERDERDEHEEHHSRSEGEHSEDESEEEESEEEESEEEAAGFKASNNAGFFAALDASDDESEEEEEEESDDE